MLRKLLKHSIINIVNKYIQVRYKIKTNIEDMECLDNIMNLKP